MYFVISVLPISITSGAAAAREGRVELLEMVAPVLVLDVRPSCRDGRLELLVRGGDEVRPAGLRVDLQPHGDAAGGRPSWSRPTSRPRSRPRGRRRDRERRCCVSSSGSLQSQAAADRAASWYRPLLHLRGMLSQRSPSCQYQISEIVVLACTTGRRSREASRGSSAIGDRRAAADAELGDEPVAVAAVGRARELDDLAGRRSASRARRAAPASAAARRATADSSSFVTVGSTVCVPPTIAMP